MSHTLNELNIANITESELQKLQEAEKAINAKGTRKEEVYLIALNKREQ